MIQIFEENTVLENRNAIFFKTTMGRTNKVFVPKKNGEISIYLCGPTVYDDIHIGNSRPIIVIDALVSFFKNFFYKDKITIKYVRNITDIDEKITNRCTELNIPFPQFIEEQIKCFNDIIQYIQINSPLTCRVTENMDAIIKNIQLIINKGHGYVSERGNVYFKVENFPEYKILAGPNRQDIRSVTVENEDDKLHWEDFALWKVGKDFPVTWESPWGNGVPGWHIECSSLINKNLGDSIDIHGGGEDLIFPHHDNELAQCWAMGNHIFCENWLHNGMVLVEGKKMSKSLGNFIKLKDIVKDRETGDIVKYLILSTHYRQPLNFSKTKWEDSENNVKKIKNFLRDNMVYWRSEDYDKFMEGNNNDLIKDLAQDFNTPAAISKLHSLIKEFKNMSKNKDISDSQSSNLKHLYYCCIFILKTMSLELLP